MKNPRFRALPRQEWPGLSCLGVKKDENVKFFLDKRDGRRYAPRSLSEGPTLRGCNVSAPSPVN